MAKIKYLVMDVDGTLTDGHIYMGEQGEVMCAFSVKDGYGLANMLPEMGITPMIITGRKSECVKRRAADLGITHLYRGVDDKLTLLKEICEQMNITPEEIAYIGDDLNDIECIEYCGLTACPADSVGEVLRFVDYVCKANGGRGAVREFIDYILENDY